MLYVVDPYLGVGAAANGRWRAQHLTQLLGGCLACSLLVNTAALRQFLRCAYISVLCRLALSLAWVVLLKDHLSLAVSGVELVLVLLSVVELVDRVSYLSLLCFHGLQLPDVWAVVGLIALLELRTQHDLHLVAVSRPRVTDELHLVQL